jgi:AraC family 4-hydroxyphenylacetate 3-monooxygenase operon regulatory protein
MDLFTMDLHLASLPMRLTAIGFIRDDTGRNRQPFQHRHNLFELHYIFEGQCIIRIGDKLCTQQQNKVYLIAPGVYHSQKSCSSPFEKMCVIFEIAAPPQPGDKDAEAVYNALHAEPYFLCNADKMADTLAYLRSTFLDYGKRICCADELRIITELLLLQLVQRISIAHDRPVSPTNLVETQRVFLIDEFFNSNFNRNDGDILLAQRLNVSIRQLNRILRKSYGHNFREKLMEIRLEIAMDLLSSDKSIAEISEITGYSCPANFSTFIKNATGKTPSEVRALWGIRTNNSETFPVQESIL